MSEQTPLGTVWSDIAAWYDGLLQAGSGPHETAIAALTTLLPESLRSSAVLDVACGQGLATRALAAAGARTVLGIDAAQSMIDLAREHTDENHAIRFRVDDAQTLSSCQDASFDGATCQLGLMDIADLDGALRSVRRVLKPGGWFVFVISHPAFLAPHAVTVPAPDGRQGRLVNRYFESEYWRSSNPAGIRGRAGSYHRPLSVYLNTLLAARLRLDVALEPQASQLLAEEQPVYQQVPIFFAARTIAT
jgi:ubiquinone/menaquinone biosynthesis C-methylase UbiE